MAGAEGAAADSKLETVTKQKPASRPAERSFMQQVAREGVLTVLVTAVVLGCVRWYLASIHPDKLMITPERLAKFDGKNSTRIYLSVLGSVFDVTAGRRHYGPEGNYHGAAGRDASKAFYTGEFKLDNGTLIDDLSSANEEEMASVYRWRGFFRDHKVYKRVGRLIGRFYTSDGSPTEELRKAEAAGEAAAAKVADSKGDSHVECNTQWTKGTGGKTLWCPEGKGYPRKVADQSTQDRCVCMPSTATSAVLTLYPGCAADATKCVIKGMAEA